MRHETDFLEEGQYRAGIAEMALPLDRHTTNMQY